ncbi:MAG: hypothetical protein IIX50_03115, partial [Bacteroidaceae bacterium]|nr:hypothetical protein [Bacteroidaceae bacterium]
SYVYYLNSTLQMYSFLFNVQRFFENFFKKDKKQDNREDTLARCKKYSSKLDISRSLIRSLR